MAEGKIVIETGLDSSELESGLKKLGSLAQSGGKVAVAAIGVATTAITGFGAYSVKVGSSFESAMSQVAATMGMTADEVNNGSAEFELLSNAAKEAGATTQFSATQAGEALNYLALAGYDAAQSAEALPVVLNLAAAGGLDLAYASDLATDAMAALGIEANKDNLTKFGDEMAKTASKSNTSVAQLGEAILTVGGTAKSLAGDTTELNACLGVLANRGIKGAEGGTALRNVILALSAPTDKAADKMKELGLQVYDADGNMRPLNETFKDLDKALSGMGEGKKTEVLNEIFNKVDLKSAQALLAGCGDEFDELADAIANSDGAMADMAETMNDNLAGKVKILQSATEGFGIAVYEGMQEPLKEMVVEGTDAIDRLSAAFAKGGLQRAVEEAGSVLAELATKAAEGIPAMVEAGVQMVQAFVKGIRNNAPQLASAALDVAQALAKGLASFLPAEMVKPTQKAIDSLAKSFKEGNLKKVIDDLVIVFKNLSKIVGCIGKTVIPILTKAIDLLAGNMKILVPVLTAGVAALKTYKIVTTISKTLDAMTKSTALLTAAESSQALATAVSTGAITLKQIAIGILTGEITLVTVAQAAWNAVMNANPIGLLITAAAALAAGLAAVVLTIDNTIERTIDIKEVNEELIESINEQCESWERLGEARDEATKAAEAESNHLTELWHELQKITDENGKVKEGYEERAGFIVNELNNATDLEIEMIDNTISSYHELEESVEDVIKVKKAQAILDANYDSYVTAIQNQTDAYMDLQKQAKVVESRKKELAKADKELQEANENLSKAEASGVAIRISQANKEKNAKQETYDEIIGKLAEEEDAYNELSDTYTEYNTTIENYEGLSAAIISGDTESITSALENLKNGFKTTTTATKEELEEQVKAYKLKLAEMEKAVEDGAPGITQAHITEMENMVSKAEGQLADLAIKGEEGMGAVGDAQIDGYNSKNVPGFVEKEIGKIGPKGAEALNSADRYMIAQVVKAGLEGKLSEQSKKNVKAFLEQMDGMDEDTKRLFEMAVKGALEGSEMGDEIAQKAEEGGTSYLEALAEVLEVHSPSRAVKRIFGYVMPGALEGLDEGKEGVLSSASGFVSDFLGKFQDANLKDSMKKTGSEVMSSFGKGASSKTNNSMKIGKENATAANKGAGSVDPTSTGSKFGDSFGGGIKGTLAAICSAGTSIAMGGRVGLQSIKTNDSGKTFGTGFGEGIRGTLSAVSQASKAIGSGAINAISNLKSETKSIGSFFSSGLAEGIKNGISGVINAAKNVANAAANAAKNALGIASPSKVGIGIGGWFDAGIEKGVDDNAVNVERATERLADNMTTPFDFSMLAGRMKAAVDSEVSKIGKQLSANFQLGTYRAQQSYAPAYAAAGTATRNITVETPVYLDGREIARGTAEYIDDGLGRTTGRRERGN